MQGNFLQFWRYAEALYLQVKEKKHLFLSHRWWRKIGSVILRMISALHFIVLHYDIIVFI